MVLKEVIKKASGKYLSFYNLVYENKLGKKKVYEMVSHNEIELGNSSILSDSVPRAVVIIPLSTDRQMVCLNKEYRLAVNALTYNTVAGLIESGESVEDAARRELKEETGLDLVEIIDVLPPCYSAVGISNERTICIFCTASGVLSSVNAGDDEEIEPIWVSKEEYSRLLSEGVNMAARTQMFGYMWLHSNL